MIGILDITAAAAALIAAADDAPDAGTAVGARVIRMASVNATSDAMRVSYVDELAAQPPWQVQVGAYRSREEAEAAWSRLSAQHDALLDGLAPAISEVELDSRGAFVRLRVEGYPSRSGAVDLCEDLRAAGGECFVAHR
ncbi:hypothetical protein DDZ18_02995 [Marinicauda salina]|uniref:SPOR domain-containing protein n=1 Tax=Marinicauda salina TaxID=2135793 RepID=A0A2U2BX47_9PROT|nr:SPOR domain-containing protein [Marinicauda salina]PWE18585.1 hypothetical protein DDZ18_02995 [Marinicauda salina]